MPSAIEARRRILDGTHDRVAFRAALLAVAPTERDAWLDRVLDLGALPDDSPDLPRGCVPYLPCGVAALLGIVDDAAIGPGDVFVDIGAGIGRATAAVHLLTGAAAVGIEIQPALAAAAEALAGWISPRIATVCGDAAEQTDALARGTVFFLYSPFSGARLAQVLAHLEAIAATRPIRVCTVDVPLPPRAWLVPQVNLIVR